MDVEAWLRGLGLERYERAFRDNDIDAGLLRSLIGDDLQQIGITSLGHRKRLLAAIASLPLQADVQPSTNPLSEHASPAPQTERRQLTVLFIDLVGSTALSARLDPEELRVVMRAYQSACAAAVTRSGGHVAKFLGDGVLAYFGWPLAHEDAAERAVRAGLEVVDVVPRLVTSAHELLSARVGVATGLAVVGDLLGAGAAREEAVVGEVANVAARLQQLAEPGTIVIADGSRRLLGGMFDLVDLGSVGLRGLPEPVRAWRVAGLRDDAASRFEARQSAGLAPLVGREHELRVLLERWSLVQNGRGQAVLLIGEPGVGKSRLAEALAQRLAAKPHAHLICQCSPQHTGSALYPIAAHLERAAGFHREDEAGTRLAKLAALLNDAGVEPTALPPIAGLLGVLMEPHPEPPELPPHRRKERVLEALLAYMAAIARHRPTLLVVEDLHWIDPTSLELLGLLASRLSDLRMLAVLTARPEFTPPWATSAALVSLLVDRLRPGQAVALAEGVSGKALPTEMLEQIVGRTDGIPLFVEELTRTVIEGGLLIDAGDRYVLDGPLPPLAIPTTLQDSLMARLDRLGPAKRTAQLAACLGREFGHEMLAAVADQDDERLGAALDALAASGLLMRHGERPRATYAFRHALVQEAAYSSLLRARRQELHARIAATVEARFPDIVGLRPEWLAHHHAEAGQIEPAAELWLRAAQRSKDAHANQEARSHLGRCLGLVEMRRQGNGAAAPELVGHELCCLVLLGDLASLEGDLQEANRCYGQALAIASDARDRSRIERKRHRPRTAFRDGARIAFYEHGRGPETLVFVAPLAYGLAMFQPIVEPLCQEFRVVTIDSRGTGASDPLVRPYPLSEHVLDVRAVIEALGQKVVGIGLSRGANLLLKLAHAAPHLLGRLVTIGCSPGPPGQPPFFSEEFLNQNRILVARGELEPIVRFHTSLVFSEPATRELRESFVRQRLGLPHETMLSFFDPDLTTEVIPILGEIDLPVLVTHGGADRLIALEAAGLLMARLPQATLHVFEGTGHLPLFTATEEFCQVLRRFIGGRALEPSG
jgi:class 3 adenylate cyclase/pimeloyl-ACP methyl ester carboxylesterase